MSPLHPVVREARDFAKTFYSQRPLGYLLQKAVLLNAARLSRVVSHAQFARLLESFPGNTFKSLLFQNFCAGESIQDVLLFKEEYLKQGIYTMLDRIGEADPSAASSSFTATPIDSLLPSLTKEESLGLNVSVKLSAYFDPEKLVKISRDISSKELSRDVLRQNDILTSFDSLADRLSQVSPFYSVAVDAESSELQPAISAIAILLMMELNKSSVRIYNTYQAYLKDSSRALKLDVQRSKNHAFNLGAKLVRGAYLSHEQKLDPAPVFEDISQTHRNYDHLLELLVSTSSLEDSIIAATHNENSVGTALALSDKLGANSLVFAQLFGMRDYLTHFLVHKKQKVYKYVPFGSPDRAIPYLMRRTEENSSVLEGLIFERSLITRAAIKKLFFPIGL